MQNKTKWGSCLGVWVVVFVVFKVDPVLDGTCVLLPVWLFTALPNWIPDVILWCSLRAWLSKPNTEKTKQKVSLRCCPHSGLVSYKRRLPPVADGCCINWPKAGGFLCIRTRPVSLQAVPVRRGMRLMRLLCFLFLPSCPLLVCRRGRASTLWHDMSIQSNIGLQFLHAYENTSCEFACTGHAHQTAASI